MSTGALAAHDAFLKEFLDFSRRSDLARHWLVAVLTWRRWQPQRVRLAGKPSHDIGGVGSQEPADVI